MNSNGMMIPTHSEMGHNNINIIRECSPIQMGTSIPIINEACPACPGSPLMQDMGSNEMMNLPSSPRGEVNMLMNNRSRSLSPIHLVENHSELIRSPSPMIMTNDMMESHTPNGNLRYDNDIFKSSILVPQYLRPKEIVENVPPMRWEKKLFYAIVDKSYLDALDSIDETLKTLRTKLVERNLEGLEMEINHIKRQVENMLNTLENTISNDILSPQDFDVFEIKIEKIMSTYLPKINFLDLDLRAILNPDKNFDIPCCLSIISQETSGPVIREKPIGSFSLFLITGVTVTSVQQITPVQPIIVEPSKQRGKRINQELENSKQIFKEDGNVIYNDLKFTNGTFPHLVPIKFKTEVEISLFNGQKVKKTLESPSSKPFISMTNAGSQWLEAAGTWLKDDCFREKNEVTVQKFWNYFQKHFLSATKQELNNIKRPLYQKDYEYLILAKLSDKKIITHTDYKNFWDWIGKGLKKIRYQKHLQFLFVSG
jgi:hypothetical protein